MTAEREHKPSNGVWAESVLKILKGKVAELEHQLGSLCSSIKLIEDGFDLPQLVMPSFMQEMKAEHEAKLAASNAALEEPPASEPVPDPVPDTVTVHVREIGVTRLPNIKDAP